MRRNGGIVFGISAYLIWGFFPIYWKLLDNVPAAEIILHRIIWSFLFMFFIFLFRSSGKQLFTVLHKPRVLGIFLISGLLLSLNWFTYVWAVNNGYVVEASLGYFINPLFNVLLGVALLKEKLRYGQLAAIILAGIGVVYLTVKYGAFPWIGLTLALTFGFYGLVRKTAPLGSIGGLSAEMALLVLPAFFLLLFFRGGFQGLSAAYNGRTLLFLILSGAVTAIPLLLFTAAARRIPLSVLGLLQYIAPTLQFLVGVWLYHEVVSSARLTGFIIIWVALIVYSLEGMLHSRLTRVRQE